MTKTSDELIADARAAIKRGDVVSRVNMAFDWGLASREGAWFVLFREPRHTDDDVKFAKHRLRSDRDVVTLSVKLVKEDLS